MVPGAGPMTVDILGFLGGWQSCFVFHSHLSCIPWILKWVSTGYQVTALGSIKFFKPFLNGIFGPAVHTLLLLDALFPWDLQLCLGEWVKLTFKLQGRKFPSSVTKMIVVCFTPQFYFYGWSEYLRCILPWSLYLITVMIAASKGSLCFMHKVTGVLVHVCQCAYVWIKSCFLLGGLSVESLLVTTAFITQ